MIFIDRNREYDGFDVVQMLFHKLKHAVELDLLFRAEDSLKFMVEVDKPAFFGVLEPVAFDVLP